MTRSKVRSRISSISTRKSTHNKNEKRYATSQRESGWSKQISKRTNSTGYTKTNSILEQKVQTNASLNKKNDTNKQEEISSRHTRRPHLKSLRKNEKPTETILIDASTPTDRSSLNYSPEEEPSNDTVNSTTTLHTTKECPECGTTSKKMKSSTFNCVVCEYVHYRKTQRPCVECSRLYGDIFCDWCGDAFHTKCAQRQKQPIEDSDNFCCLKCEAANQSDDSDDNEEKIDECGVCNISFHTSKDSSASYYVNQAVLVEFDDALYNAIVTDVNIKDEQIKIHFLRWSKSFDDWYAWDDERVNESLACDCCNQWFHIGCLPPIKSSGRRKECTYVCPSCVDDAKTFRYPKVKSGMNAKKEKIRKVYEKKPSKEKIRMETIVKEDMSDKITSTKRQRSPEKEDKKVDNEDKILSTSTKKRKLSTSAKTDSISPLTLTVGDSDDGTTSQDTKSTSSFSSSSSYSSSPKEVPARFVNKKTDISRFVVDPADKRPLPNVTIQSKVTSTIDPPVTNATLIKKTTKVLKREDSSVDSKKRQDAQSSLSAFDILRQVATSQYQEIDTNRNAQRNQPIEEQSKLSQFYSKSPSNHYTHSKPFVLPSRTPQAPSIAVHKSPVGWSVDRQFAIRQEMYFVFCGLEEQKLITSETAQLLRSLIYPTSEHFQDLKFVYIVNRDLSPNVLTKRLLELVPTLLAARNNSTSPRISMSDVSLADRSSSTNIHGTSLHHQMNLQDCSKFPPLRHGHYSLDSLDFQRCWDVPGKNLFNTD